MTTDTLPLLGCRTLQQTLAWHQGQPISAGQFVAEAQALALRLPVEGRPINLCQDRYLFALGLAAALLRGQCSLMPPNALPDTLRQLQQPDAAPAYVLDDAPPAARLLPGQQRPDYGGLHSVRVQRLPVPGPATQLPAIPVQQPAVTLLTSGSTGTPQPHTKCWGPLVANIRAEAQRLGEHLQWAERRDLYGLSLVATVPAQHSYGLESSVLLALLGGAAFDAGRPFYPADIATALGALPAPRALVTTPFHLKALLQAGLPLPETALTLSATAPLSPQLAAQAESALQGQLVEIYGCTEAGQVASRRTTAGDVWHTLDALRIDSRPTPQGEQFVVSGGHVPVPTPLADVLQLQDGPQQARHFRLLGRANDLIHVAGKRSSLAHLNFQLNRIEGVHDGAFWLPDDVAEGVVRPVAFVVAPGLSAAQITAALRQQLDSVFVPRRVLHVAALPREATGKLAAQALRQFALQQLQPAADPDSHHASFPIAADHPAFEGHFPGQPILPGVVLLALVLQALDQAPALAARLPGTPRVDNVKFLAPVLPDSQAPVQIDVQLRWQGRSLAFELHCGTQVVARGQLGAVAPA